MAETTDVINHPIPDIEEFKRIFTDSQKKVETMSDDEILSHRNKLSRAMYLLKIELQATNATLSDKAEKADGDRKRKLMESDKTYVPKTPIPVSPPKMSPQDKLIGSLMKALGCDRETALAVITKTATAGK